MARTGCPLPSRARRSAGRCAPSRGSSASPLLRARSPGGARYSLRSRQPRARETEAEARRERSRPVSGRDASCYTRRSPMGSIIAIANQKGGVGKTTTTANLGASLALRGFRVLLVDMDPQGNLTAAFGHQPRDGQTVAEALLDRKLPLPIVSVTEPGGASLDLVPASVQLAAAEALLTNKLGRELRLRDALGTVSDQYDFVLIDTPPSLGLLTTNALVAAQKVIIPT